MIPCRTTCQTRSIRVEGSLCQGDSAATIPAGDGLWVTPLLPCQGWKQDVCGTSQVQARVHGATADEPRCALACCQHQCRSDSHGARAHRQRDADGLGQHIRPQQDVADEVVHEGLQARQHHEVEVLVQGDAEAEARHLHQRHLRAGVQGLGLQGFRHQCQKCTPLCTLSLAAVLGSTEAGGL